jgi:hypothetical protein
MPKEDKHFWDETRKPWMDLEGEQRAVKPQKSAKKHARANENTGVGSQMMAGFFQEMVMQEALKDASAATESNETALDESWKIDANTMKGQDQETEQEEGLEDDLEIIRRRRYEELVKQSTNRSRYLGLGHGRYSEIAEIDFLKTVTDSPRVVVHFYHKDFRRCALMDEHLTKLAPASIGCRFVKLDAEKSPFFVGKLKVKILPTVVFFIDGVAIHRLVGFDGLAGADECRTIEIVRELEEYRMLIESDEATVHKAAEEAKEQATKEDDQDDDEWDYDEA